MTNLLFKTSSSVNKSGTIETDEFSSSFSRKKLNKGLKSINIKQNIQGLKNLKCSQIAHEQPKINKRIHIYKK